MQKLRPHEITRTAALRRRLADLRDAGYTDDWLAPFEKAAELMALHERAENLGELAAALELLAQNRGLKAKLFGLGQAVQRLVTNQKREQHAIVNMTKSIVHSLEQIGAGRMLLTVDIGPDHERADIEAKISAMLDRHFRDKDRPPTDAELAQAVIDTYTEGQPHG